MDGFEFYLFGWEDVLEILLGKLQVSSFQKPENMSKAPEIRRFHLVFTPEYQKLTVLSVGTMIFDDLKRTRFLFLTSEETPLLFIGNPED